MIRTKLETMVESLAQTEFGLQLFDLLIKTTLLLGGLLVASLLMRSVFKCSAAQRASAAWIGALAIPVVAIACFQADGLQEGIWEVQVDSPLEIAAAPSPFSLPEETLTPTLKSETVDENISGHMQPTAQETDRSGETTPVSISIGAASELAAPTSTAWGPPRARHLVRCGSCRRYVAPPRDLQAKLAHPSAAYGRTK